MSRGQHEVGQVNQALVNLLVQAIALSAQNSVPVLHSKRDAHQAVMLGDGQVEDLVRLKKRLEDGPALQHHAANVHLLKELGIGENHLGSLGARSSLNARTQETAAWLIATDVSDNNPLCAGLPTLAHHLRHHFRIGGGSLVWSAIPGDVGLDHHHVLAADETANAAQILEGFLNQRARLPALDNRNLRAVADRLRCDDRGAPVRPGPGPGEYCAR